VLVSSARGFLGALVLAAWSMLPISAAAAPNPSPTLAQIMLPAPSDYTAETSSALSGSFTSHNLSSAWGTRAAEAQTALEQDGFVDGYGITVVNHTVHHRLVEYIVVFAGGLGAMKWLSFAEAGDKADPTYQHSDSISGIDSYYGEHNAYPSNNVSDAFVFVKGNDFFVVGFESTQDNVLNLAITRAKNQYDSAPKSTIPAAQWPENVKAATSPQGAASPDATFDFGGLMAGAIIAVLVVGVILLVAGLAMRYRRGRTLAAAAPLEMPAGVQTSPDGGFWWDGEQWRPVP
jgi:hypothetical protein